MPFKSQAQRRKFEEMVKQGKMTQAEFSKWNSETPHEIPERLGEKKLEKMKTLKPIKVLK